MDPGAGFNPMVPEQAPPAAVVPHVPRRGPPNYPPRPNVMGVRPPPLHLQPPMVPEQAPPGAGVPPMVKFEFSEKATKFENLRLTFDKHVVLCVFLIFNFDKPDDLIRLYRRL